MLTLYPVGQVPADWYAGHFAFALAKKIAIDQFYVFYPADARGGFDYMTHQVPD
jgi:hypothetical protein